MANIVDNLKSISKQLGIKLMFDHSIPTVCSPVRLKAIVINLDELKAIHQGADFDSAYIRSHNYDMNNWDFFLIQAYLHEFCHWKQYVKYGRKWYRDSMNDEYAEQIAHKFAVRYSKKYRILV